MHYFESILRCMVFAYNNHHRSIRSMQKIHQFWLWSVWVSCHMQTNCTKLLILPKTLMWSMILCRVSFAMQFLQPLFLKHRNYLDWSTTLKMLLKTVSRIERTNCHHTFWSEKRKRLFWDAVTKLRSTSTCMRFVTLFKVEKFRKSNFFISNCISLGLKYPDLRTQYNNTSRQIQKWINFLHVATVLMAPVFIISPPVIASCFAYFTTDLGDDSLELPLPMW